MAVAGLHCSLKQLDLSFNKLGDSAARALAGMMSAAPLLALELEGNMVRGEQSNLPCRHSMHEVSHSSTVRVQVTPADCQRQDFS